MVKTDKDKTEKSVELKCEPQFESTPSAHDNKYTMEWFKGGKQLSDSQEGPYKIDNSSLTITAASKQLSIFSACKPKLSLSCFSCLDMIK